MQNELILSDEYEQLKAEINALKMEIACLLQEKYELEYVICPSLNALYMEKFGDYTKRIMAKRLMVEELRYRIQLLRAALNREEEIDEEEIDQKVQEEYEEYHRQMDEQFQQAEEEKEREQKRRRREAEQEARYNESKARTSKNVDPDEEEADADDENGEDEHANQEDASKSEEAEEKDEFEGMSFKQKLKELYRRIVKKLHPDMNPNLTDRDKELWLKAQDAYQNGDIDTLEEIYNEINRVNPEEVPDTAEGREQLLKLLHQLKVQRATLLSDIQAIKETYPYTEKELLEDEEATRIQQQELQATIDQLDEQMQLLNQIINELMEELNAQE